MCPVRCVTYVSGRSQCLSGFSLLGRGGGFQRAPGSPSPKYQNMKQPADKVRDLFPPGSIAYEFFSKLSDSAANMLERERLDDEQYGFD